MSALAHSLRLCQPSANAAANTQTSMARRRYMHEVFACMMHQRVVSGEQVPVTGRPLLACMTGLPSGWGAAQVGASPGLSAVPWAQLRPDARAGCDRRMRLSQMPTSPGAAARLFFGKFPVKVLFVVDLIRSSDASSEPMHHCCAAFL